jgi:tetrahydromethanopterin S-methyltransferase subunit C
MTVFHRVMRHWITSALSAIYLTFAAWHLQSWLFGVLAGLAIAIAGADILRAIEAWALKRAQS